MRRVITILFSFISLVAFALDAPKADIQYVYKTTLTVSWTKPLTATGFVLQRSINSDYSGATTIYTGGQQVFDDASLVENTTYYYRVKATNATEESTWTILSQKTFWTPNSNASGSHNPPGRTGNRFADATDVAFYGGNVNLGDFLVVGYNSGNSTGGEFGFGVGISSNDYGAFPWYKNKIIFIGGIAYSWVDLNMEVWAGTADSMRVVTNSIGTGGNAQVLCNAFQMQNTNNVLLTAKYDAAKKTGHSSLLGYDAVNWNDLSEHWGFYFRGNYASTNNFGLHIIGNCSNTIIEYIEAGEGGYTAVSVKNDGYALKTFGNAYRTFAVPNTGAGVYTTISYSDVYIPYASTQVRAATFEYFPPTETGSYSPFRVNWIEFEHNVTHVITRIQTEGYIGALRASALATADVDGVNDLYLEKDNSAADYLLGTPLAPGSYTVRARVSSAISTGIFAIKLGTSPFDGFQLRYSYIHDLRAGEGGYAGSTQPDPQQIFTNLWVHHCIFTRNGLNTIQTGQMAGANRVNNVVGMNAGMAWSNTFQKFQDQTIQQSSRTAGYKYDHNLWTGGGESGISAFAQLKLGMTSLSSDTNIYDNNAFLNILGPSGGYINTKDPGGQLFKMSRNIFGRFNAGGARYSAIYPAGNPTINYVVNFESSPDPVFTESEAASGVATMRVGSNIYDHSFNAGDFILKSGYTANLTVIDSANNVRQPTVPYPDFGNYMDLPDDYDYSKLEYWTGAISPQWNWSNWSVNTYVVNTATSSSVTIPTTHPTSVTFTIGGWEPYNVGDTVLLDNDIYTNGTLFSGVVTAYNTGTGSMTISSRTHSGSGTFSTNWTLSKVRHYPLDQIVSYNRRFYKSLTADNYANEPALNGDPNWELLVFSNGSLKPPDDVRLNSSDYYYNRGVGLGIPSGYGTPSRFRFKSFTVKRKPIL